MRTLLALLDLSRSCRRSEMRLVGRLGFLLGWLVGVLPSFAGDVPPPRL